MSNLGSLTIQSANITNQSTSTELCVTGNLQISKITCGNIYTSGNSSHAVLEFDRNGYIHIPQSIHFYGSPYNTTSGTGAANSYFARSVSNFSSKGPEVRFFDSTVGTTYSSVAAFPADSRQQVTVPAGGIYLSRIEIGYSGSPVGQISVRDNIGGINVLGAVLVSESQGTVTTGVTSSGGAGSNPSSSTVRRVNYTSPLPFLAAGTYQVSMATTNSSALLGTPAQITSPNGYNFWIVMQGITQAPLSPGNNMGIASLIAPKSGVYLLSLNTISSQSTNRNDANIIVTTTSGTNKISMSSETVNGANNFHQKSISIAYYMDAQSEIQFENQNWYFDGSVINDPWRTCSVVYLG